jgi:glycosyltransferase involved in cell wall biosynthesis
MRIGIDALPLRTRRTGIGNYIYNLIQLFPRFAPCHDYLLYSNREVEPQFPEGSIQKRLDSGFRWWPGSLWLLTRGRTLIKADQINVFWATGAVLPPSIPACVRKIVTVYDLVWLRYPETMARYTLYVHKMWAEASIARADLVVTISASTRDELVRSLGVPLSKTRVIYPAASERYKIQDSSVAAQFISAKYAVPSYYMAAAGTIEPRKNLEVLIRALGILKTRNQLNCPLLIAGAKGWKNSSLFRTITEVGLTQNDVRFLGYLPDDDMASFYAGAQLFLFPSLYEGFGFPPIEAMACGTPVIASDSQCMPESLGSAATLVPARSPDLFAAAIFKALSDENLRRSMRAAGIQQAQQFRWEDSAKQLLRVLQGPAQQT